MSDVTERLLLNISENNATFQKLHNWLQIIIMVNKPVQNRSGMLHAACLLLNEQAITVV